METPTVSDGHCCSHHHPPPSWSETVWLHLVKEMGFDTCCSSSGSGHLEPLNIFQKRSMERGYPLALPLGEGTDLVIPRNFKGSYFHHTDPEQTPPRSLLRSARVSNTHSWHTAPRSKLSWEFYACLNNKHYKVQAFLSPLSCKNSRKHKKLLNPVRSHTRTLPGPTPTFGPMSGALRFTPPAAPL